MLCLFLLSPVRALSLEERAKELNENADCAFAYHSFLYTETYVPFQGGKAVWDSLNLTQCQAVDMLLLYDKLQELRDIMRSQALSCQPYDELKLEYMRTKLEQIFVREIWPYRLTAFGKERLEAEVLAIPEELAKLKESMKERFIGDGDGKIKMQISENQFDTWFAEWTEQYKNRIPNYIYCKQDAWAQVTEIKNSLNYKFGEILIAYFEFREALKIKQNIQNYYKNLGLFQKNEEDPRFKFFGSLGKGNLKEELQNWEEAWQNAGDVYDNFYTDIEKDSSQKNLLVADLSPGLSFDEAIALLDSQEIALTLETDHLAREARYSVRYGANGELVQQKQEQEVFAMTQSLQQSKSSILNMLQNGEKIYERQCR